MLALSSTSDTEALKGIVKSTAAIIFLGTPHRGSPEFAAVGETARALLHILSFQTTAAILNALACKTTDLERAYDAFSRLWQKYDFRVKTFQEGFSLTKIGLGILGHKVVPDSSSIIGDHREQAETLQANHMGICRFKAFNDVNYIKVSAAIQSYYRDIEKAQLSDNSFNGNGRAPMAPEQTRSRKKKKKKKDRIEQQNDQKRLIESLHFENMNSRKHAIRAPSANTSEWLPQNHIYHEWFVSKNSNNHLLLIKGKAGAGKSTLMKEASRQALFDDRVHHVASFFINSNGQPLEHSPCGVLRALLCQLLPFSSFLNNTLLDCSTKMAKAKHKDLGLHEEVKWEQATLENYLIHVLRDLSPHMTLIFIDALDELDNQETRWQVEFWGALVDVPELQHLRVCLSCRHFPSISMNKSLQLSLEDFNKEDIYTYIWHRLEMRVSNNPPFWRDMLAAKLSLLSRGVFLWVVLVMDNVLSKYDEGKNLT